ncbi:uncharacterized protein METZ01_LOCUS143179 [marine metagenome]|uniref:Uncharacterized protein n=1 Tax=marine metagenome TaxID=408172 RepID=A0A381ZM50_9ZZZZ
MQIKKMVVKHESSRSMGYSPRQLTSVRSTICSELFMLGAQARVQTFGIASREVGRPPVC